LQKDFDEGKVQRIQHEKDMYKKIGQESKTFYEKYEAEKESRKNMFKNLTDKTHKELMDRDKLFEEYNNVQDKNCVGMKDEIWSEMNNRFAHQNEVVTDISQFLKSFQDTLKIVGKDI